MLAALYKIVICGQTIKYIIKSSVVHTRQLTEEEQEARNEDIKENWNIQL